MMRKTISLNENENEFSCIITIEKALKMLYNVIVERVEILFGSEVV